MQILRTFILVITNLLLLSIAVSSQSRSHIVHDTNKKTVTLSDSSENLVLCLKYANGCVLDKMLVNGKEVLGNGNIAYSGVRVGDNTFSSAACTSSPEITIQNNVIKISDIKFGNATI